MWSAHERQGLPLCWWAGEEARTQAPFHEAVLARMLARAEGLLCAMLGLADALVAAPRIQNSPQVGGTLPVLASRRYTESARGG